MLQMLRMLRQIERGVFHTGGGVRDRLKAKYTEPLQMA